MEDQLEIVEQLKKTLELLSVKSQTRGPQASSRISNSSTQLSQFSYRDLANAYIDFTYENPTVYHVIQFAARHLENHGFKYIRERELWDNKVSKDGGRYYTTRNGTSLVAFVIGKDWTPSKGVGAIACHADALSAKLKPASVKPLVEGFELLGVAPYGGTLGEQWFDRDLGIGGRVLYRDEHGSGDIKSALINSTPYPIAKIPTLAPHFGKPSEGPFDKEDQAVPIVGYSGPDDHTQEATDEEKRSPLYGKHSIKLLRYVAKLAGIKVSQLVQMDLELFDVQKGSIGGLDEDFLFAPRLDDRLCSFAGIQAMTKFADTINERDYNDFILLALFDNEEVGSRSRQGAQGGLLQAVIERAAMVHSNALPADIRDLYANTLIASADVNHMFNPNFKEIYLENHSPKPNTGITISLDPNGHMATDNVGLAIVEELARRNGDKVQYFQIKNNSRSGGTVGPYLSLTGARTIDLGIAQMSMHSIRAVTGSKDVGLGTKFMIGFYKDWRKVYDEFGDL